MNKHTLIIASSFSIDMLAPNISVIFQSITQIQVDRLLFNSPCDTIISIVGHQIMADFLSEKLGVNIPMNRINFIWDNSNADANLLVCMPAIRLCEGQVLSFKEIKDTEVKYTLCELV